MQHDHTFVQDPTPEFLKNSDGKVCAAYVRIREGKACRAVQPDPKHLIYLYLGSDGLPVGVKLLEPKTGAVLSSISHVLSSDTKGRPIGVDCHEKHAWLSREEANEFLRRITDSSTRAEDKMELCY